MIAPEILKRIREVEIHTRRILNGTLVGDSRSAVKGSGFEFDQIREYQAGDDVRFIDWKASARTNKLLIKQYIEERSRTVVIALDVSRSGNFTTSNQTKYQVMSEVAAVLSLVADYGKDSVGLLLFADEVLAYMPPKKGRSYVHSIMQKIFECNPTGKATAFGSVLGFLARIKRRDMLIVMISDFIDIQAEVGVEKLLFAVRKKGDIVAIRCLDIFEEKMPALGFLVLEDIETGESGVLDMRKAAERKISAYLHDRQLDQQKFFKRYSVDCLDITTSRPFVGDIIQFFRRRMTY